MAKRTGPKVAVSRRALIQRINRVLAKNDEALKARRGGRRQIDGDYFIVNVARNWMVQEHVWERDLEALGREMEVLAGYEELEEVDDAR